MPNTSYQLSFTPVNNKRLNALCGPQNEHLAQIEAHFGVEILQRSHIFEIIGGGKSAQAAKHALNALYHETKKHELTQRQIHLFLQSEPLSEASLKEAKIKTTRENILPRGKHQQSYINNIHQYDMNFGIGPAGTGKTYLAVACAVEALEKEEVQRLIFVRPAVEAGENLGFLPGDLEEKILPYLRPIYDALYEMMGFEHAAQLIEQNVIEVAPLAYMRGRTLNDAFIILDEAQNTTIEQMQMFLTRIGFGSTAVITGDVTQIDLARGTKSGLNHAIQVLKDIEGISFSYFDSSDAVRHPLVESIINAYEKFNAQDKK